MLVRPVLDMVIRKRGMLWDFGGHAARLFVDRACFDTHPEMFRTKKGERRSDGNFCPSDPNAIQMLCDGIKGCMKKDYPIGLMSVYFDDVVEGSWCDCPKCQKLSPAEQAYHSSNMVAKAVEAEFPDKKTSFLLYHDTVEMDTPQELPSLNLIGQYAPRERCYAHAINDPTCENNR